jgi:hypothetical protein
MERIGASPRRRRPDGVRRRGLRAVGSGAWRKRAIVDLLTAERGRYAAHVAGRASRKMRPFLQAGSRVLVPGGEDGRTARLGQLEPVGAGPGASSMIRSRSRGCPRRAVAAGAFRSVSLTPAPSTPSPL